MMLRIIALLITCVGFSTAQESRPTGPIIQFSPQGWNFGTITRGQQLQHTFDLKNCGDQDLVIAFAQVTCGCLKMKLEKKVLAPQESTKLRVFLDSNRQEGHIKKHIRIQSNAKNKSHLFIPVEGTINPVYRLEFPNFELGVWKQHETITKEMKVFALPDRWPEISSIEFQSPLIKVTTRRFGSARVVHGIIVTLSATADEKPGRLSIPVRINLKNDLVDAIRFMVLGVVLGDLRITPERLYLPPQEKNKRSRTTIVLSSAGARPFKILKATCHDPRVTIQFPRTKSGITHDLVITFDPKNKLGSLRTRIYIVTDRLDQQVFTVLTKIPVIP